MDEVSAFGSASAPVTDRAGRLLRGRWVGELRTDPVAVGPRRGRVRRWCYAAAGDESAAVGAAVVDLGVVGVGFAWAVVGGRTVTWDTRAPLRRGCRVAATPAGGATLRTRAALLRLGGDGGLELDVPVSGGRLRAEVRADVAVPVVLATPTPAGGWNVTQKAAGYPVAGTLDVGARRHELRATAGGWRDWTSGRQDRRTSWRWAAGAGHDAGGRRVGCNLSTGMNARGPGEDLVWWEGRPQPLALERLAPDGSAEGTWRAGGPGWALRLTPWGARSADERLLVLRSRYAQPVGRLEGTLPGPDGEPIEVALAGVTEDHLALW